jgi:hypothetical protein
MESCKPKTVGDRLGAVGCGLLHLSLQHTVYCEADVCRKEAQDGKKGELVVQVEGSER